MVCGVTEKVVNPDATSCGSPPALTLRDIKTEVIKLLWCWRCFNTVVDSSLVSFATGSDAWVIKLSFSHSFPDKLTAIPP